MIKCQKYHMLDFIEDLLLSSGTVNGVQDTTAGTLSRGVVLDTFSLFVPHFVLHKKKNVLTYVNYL